MPAVAHQLRQLWRTLLRHLRFHSTEHGGQHFAVGESGEWHAAEGEDLEKLYLNYYGKEF
jgi:hypothetical protein